MYSFICYVYLFLRVTCKLFIAKKRIKKKCKKNSIRMTVFHIWTHAHTTKNKSIEKSKQSFALP